MRNLSLIVLVIVLGGCRPQENPKPPPSALRNDEDNSLTRREMLVREFQTTEVIQIPSPDHADRYIVRATNNGIWYVSFDSLVGHTLLFKGSNFDDPMPFFMDPHNVERTLAQLKEIHQLLTNITQLQLQVHLSNDTVMIEDPGKKK